MSCVGAGAFVNYQTAFPPLTLKFFSLADSGVVWLINTFRGCQGTGRTSRSSSPDAAGHRHFGRKQKSVDVHARSPQLHGQCRLSGEQRQGICLRRADQLLGSVCADGCGRERMVRIRRSMPHLPPEHRLRRRFTDAPSVQSEVQRVVNDFIADVFTGNVRCKRVRSKHLRFYDIE